MPVSETSAFYLFDNALRNQRPASEYTYHHPHTVHGDDDARQPSGLRLLTIQRLESRAKLALCLCLGDLAPGLTE
jgi:hypothetical protein